MSEYTPPPYWLSQVRIRHLVKADLSALEWGGEYKHFRRLYAEIYQSFLQGNALLWVAELPGPGIIGQLFTQLTSSRPELADGKTRAYLYGFRVKPPFRNYGVGTRMMYEAEMELARRSFQIITLNVSIDNPDARRLYEQRGYHVIATEPGIWTYLDEKGQKQEVHEPAWRMEKHLHS